MLDIISKWMQSHCPLNANSQILVGVSGGPDSLAMMDILYRLGFLVTIAHLNHCLRENAAQHADFVAGEARKRGLPFVLGQEDVAAFAKQAHYSIEEAARVARYRFLFAQAEQIGAQVVAVGHTADDQVETVLMHFLRGAGVDGLKGMLPHVILPIWHTSIPLIRPMLAVWHEQIEEYCQQYELQPVLDESNLDPQFFRNRLRHQLVPYLEDLKPQAKKHILQTANLLQTDFEMLTNLTQQVWETCVVVSSAHVWGVRIPVLAEKPLSLQRRLIRKGVAGLVPGMHNVDFNLVQQTLSVFLNEKNAHDIPVGLNLLACRENEIGYLYWNASDLPVQQWPQVSETSEHCVIPGSVQLGTPWQITLQKVILNKRIRKSIIQNQDDYCCWLDTASLQAPLTIRARLPGDRIFPLGLGGHSVKISDLMINLKIPRRARANWPLLLSGQTVVWFPGYHLSDTFAVTPETQTAVCVRCESIQ